MSMPRPEPNAPVSTLRIRSTPPQALKLPTNSSGAMVKCNTRSRQLVLSGSPLPEVRSGLEPELRSLDR